MVSPLKKTELPKWLIAEDVSCARWFIVHTEFPRFIGEIFDDEEGGNVIGLPKGEVILIDQYPADESAAVELARLMREAGEALNLYGVVNEQRPSRPDGRIVRMTTNKIKFRPLIKRRMRQWKIKNAAQLTVALNNFWLAAEVKKNKGILPTNTQRITRQTITNYLAGRSELTTANLELILEFLNITINL